MDTHRPSRIRRKMWRNFGLRGTSATFAGRIDNEDVWTCVERLAIQITSRDVRGSPAHSYLIIPMGDQVGWVSVVPKAARPKVDLISANIVLKS